jgi:uncharacterized protein
MPPPVRSTAFIRTDGGRIGRGKRADGRAAHRYFIRVILTPDFYPDKMPVASSRQRTDRIMDEQSHKRCIAFAGSRCIAAGELAEVALRAKEAIDRGREPILLFDAVTSEPIDLDFRGTPGEVLRRLARSAGATPVPAGPEKDAPRGPGRPRLGVVAREVTLLPHHWAWLSGQPGGASVALRKLVEQARRDNDGRDRVRRAQESAYRFMSAMAGDRPGFEEATRALFAGERARFDRLVKPWPADIRAHAKKLAAVALGPVPQGAGAVR